MQPGEYVDLHLYLDGKPTIAYAQERYRIQYLELGICVLMDRLGFTKQTKALPSRADKEAQQALLN